MENRTVSGKHLLRREAGELGGTGGAYCIWLVGVQRHKVSAMRAHSIEM